MFPYDSFTLIHVNPETNLLKTCSVPEKLHGAKMICVREGYAYFRGTYDRYETLYALELGKGKPKEIGKIKEQLRGLGIEDKPHFISCDDTSVKLYYIGHD
ncbi:hypothetical protein FZC66_06010 [Priestia megaterium]|nr:hypothetical protein FZC66_06010 [Priestia megaterium]